MRAQTFAQITLYDGSGQVIYSTLPFSQDLEPEWPPGPSHLKVSAVRNATFPVNAIFPRQIYPFRNSWIWEVRGNHELGVLGVALSQNAIVQTSANSRWQIFF